MEMKKIGTYLWAGLSTVNLCLAVVLLIKGQMEIKAAFGILVNFSLAMIFATPVIEYWRARAKRRHQNKI